MTTTQQRLEYAWEHWRKAVRAHVQARGNPNRLSFLARVRDAFRADVERLSEQRMREIHATTGGAA